MNILKNLDIYEKICLAGMMPYPPVMKEEIFNKAISILEICKQKNNFNFQKSFEVETDFSNLPKKYNSEKLNSLKEQELFCKFSIKESTRNDVEATFKSIFYIIDFRIEINKHDDNFFLIILDKLEEVIEHELIHFLQYYLKKDIYGEESENLVGIPSKFDFKKHKNIQNELSSLMEEYKHDETAKNNLQEIKYLLNPKEFYPWLAESKRRFLRRYNEVSKENFNEFVCNRSEFWSEQEKADSFFKALRFQDIDLWKRAVKELWKSLY